MSGGFMRWYRMNRPNVSHHKQRGVALLTVVLVVSIVTVLATAMASRQQMDIRRAANVLSIDQLDQYARGAELIAAWGLQEDITANNGTQYDTPDETWAMPVGFEVENGSVGGQIVDLNRYLNINNLVDDDGQPVTPEIERMKRLFDALGQNTSLVDALVDWIDPNQQVFGLGGAEDGEYLLMKPPYRAANRAMLSISELQLVKGFTPEVRRELVDDDGYPLLTVFPGENKSKVNVNTASWQIIQASLKGMGDGDADTLASEEYEKLSDFMAEPVVNQAPNREEAEQMLDVSSHYFLLDGFITFGNRDLALYSVLKRNNSSGKSIVIYRSQGVN